MDNPAFDEHANSGETGTTTADSDSDSDSDSASTSASTTSDTMSTTASTTDDPETETGMEESEPDMMVEQCMPETHKGLEPRIGSGADFDDGCPMELEFYIRVHESNDGDWLAQRCAGSCSNCQDEEVVISAHGLQLADLMPPPPWPGPDSDVGCHVLQAEGGLSAPNDPECHFSAMSVFSVSGEGGLGPLEFHANRDSWGLNGTALVFLQNWAPETVEQEVEHCECTEDLDIDCCADELIVAKKFDLGEGVYVYPGEENMTTVNNVDFRFYGAQAQSGVSFCDEDSPKDQTSWALLVDD